MYAVGKLGSYISRGVVSVAAPFHPFGGAVDIVVVEQEDGSFKSSPWYVQFGKFQGVLKAREKVVIINVNGVDADFRMYLDSRGGAYFLKDADGEDGMSESVSWGGGISNLRRPKKIMSCNYDLERSKLVSEFDPGSAKFVTRSTSNGPRILGFVFDQESDNVNASQQVDAIRSEREREREGSLERAEIAADLLEVRWSTSLATRKQRKEYPSSPHSNGFHDKSSRLVHVIDEVDTDIPAPVNFMESFSLEEKHFEVGGLSSGDEHSNAFQILQGDDGSKIKIVRSGVDKASNLREMTSEVKPELSSGILTCEVDKNIEKLEGEDPLVTDDGSKSIAVLETKVEVILDCKNGEGPVKYVEETVVDQVSASQEPSLTNAFLIEDATVAALNLMENLRSENRCSSPLPDLVRLGSCENHDSIVASGPASEYSEGEQLLSSDLESLERKLALTTNFTSKQHDSDDCGESTPEISTTSSPISIARAREQVDQISHTVDPLSSSWSHGVELNPQDVDHPIRRSLDSSFDNMMLVQGDVPTISENVTQEQKTTPTKSSLEQHQLSKEFQEVLSDPAVEISLSGPLVHKGMGYEAAASAFDAEKVDAKTFISLCPDVIKNNEVVVRIGGLYFPWDAALPIISAIGAPRGEQILEPKGMILVDQVENDVKTGPQQSIDSSEGTWRLWPFKKTKTLSRNSSSVSDSTGSQRGLAGNTDTIKSEIVKKNGVRAKTPTSEQLESLNLKEGKNVVTFIFSTPMLGEQKVDAQIYLWKWNARIVISDVDGTITKSDVLGQFMPMVGVDWSQTGVTHLFSAIKENGYELLFLSARAISQASLTRQFLFNLKQDGKALPQGPVVISPDGLFPSLFREVIRRAPHEFKIACLEDIKALFPLDHNPFYAGFGNRDTDEISYVKVGIPIGKVFIINPKGEVAVHRRVDTKSYTSLHDLVNEMFPHPISVPPNEKEDYNNWNFWRLPPPDIR